MRKHILLFSHNTHAFILSDLKWAVKSFEKVVLLCPYSEEIQKRCDEFQNVKFIPLKKKSLGNMISGFFDQENQMVRKDLFSVVKEGKLSILYLKIMGTYMDCARQLLDTLDSLDISSGEEWVVLSLWFSATSYAACKAKEKYKKLAIVSLAHSFEVDSLKNRYINHFYKEYCHRMLDKISFISENVMEDYLQNYAKPLGWNFDHVQVDYLGVEKRNEGVSGYHHAEPYHIVSCSHCVPVKRIELIIEGLKQIADIRIKWSHIGGGPEWKRLQMLSKGVTQNIDVCWVGSMSNEKVHQFLAGNSIDAFLNVSSSEGLPVSMMEAIAYGIPVIATDVGGNREVVSDSNGILLPSSPSSDELVSAIKTLLLMQEEQKISLRKNAVQTYEQKFMAEHIRIKFYNELKMIG